MAKISKAESFANIAAAQDCKVIVLGGDDIAYVRISKRDARRLVRNLKMKASPVSDGEGRITTYIDQQ